MTTIEETTQQLSTAANKVLDDAIELLIENGVAVDDITMLTLPDDGPKLAWRVLAVSEVPVYEVYIERNLDAMTLGVIGRRIEPNSELGNQIVSALRQQEETEEPRLILPPGYRRYPRD